MESIQLGWHALSRQDYECPVCQAAPGEQCANKKQQPCGTHSKRSQGRSRWDIERAAAAARKAREEAEAAEQWQRDMATPPTLGVVLEVKRWMLADHTASDVADRYTVERTYANRTVQATADSGERVFLARNEYTGVWHLICGQPTSMRLPCRDGGAGVPCRVRHKPGLHLREDSSWTSWAGFIGSDTLVDSMRRVLRARGLVVEVHVLDEVAPGRASTRRELAELVQRESERVAYGTVEVPSPRRHATRVA